MEDRTPTPGQEGRVLITPENGSAQFYAKVTMADNPTNPGTPLNKETLLKDATAALYGLGTDAVPDDVFQFCVRPGTILWYASQDAPSGYLICDGSVISRADYSVLFSVIGAAFGAGDGSTTFSLPDLRAKFIRGAGTSGGYTATFGETQEASFGSARAGFVSSIGNYDKTVNTGTKGSGKSNQTAQYENIEYYLRPYNVPLTPIIKY